MERGDRACVYRMASRPKILMGQSPALQWRTDAGWAAGASAHWILARACADEEVHRSGNRKDRCDRWSTRNACRIALDVRPARDSRHPRLYVGGVGAEALAV